MLADIFEGIYDPPRFHRPDVFGGNRDDPERSRTIQNDPEEAMREADLSLYKAKSAGRNRTSYKEAA